MKIAADLHSLWKICVERNVDNVDNLVESLDYWKLFLTKNDWIPNKTCFFARGRREHYVNVLSTEKSTCLSDG